MNRAQVMESKEFALIVGEKVREALTDEQIIMFLYYTHSRKISNRKDPDFVFSIMYSILFETILSMMLITSVILSVIIAPTATPVLNSINRLNG